MLSIYIHGLRRIITNVALDSHLGILRDDNVILDWLKEQKKQVTFSMLPMSNPNFLVRMTIKIALRGLARCQNLKAIRPKGRKTLLTKAQQTGS